MSRVLLETVACAVVVCIFYTIVWWILGTQIFGLENRILIGAVVVFAFLDIAAIQYLIRRQARKKNTQSKLKDEV